MKTDGIATSTLSVALRNAMRVTQRQLEQAQIEVSTGRHADMGLALRENTGRNIDWRVEVSRLELMRTNNEVANAQADVSQQAMTTLVNAATGFLSTLTGSRNAQNGQAQVKQAAEQAMETFRTVLGTTYNGKYVFGGLNSQTDPIKTYAGGSAEASFDSAFLAEFGMAKNDAAANTIQPADMETFLNGNFDQLFDDANWQANWSNASDNNMLTSIGRGRKVDLAANANEAVIRDMFKAVTAVMDAGTGKLGQATFEKVVDYAMAKVGNVALGLGQVQARIGLVQAETTRVNDHLSRQLKILQDQITETEGVDSYEVAVRVNQLMTQVETSFSVTGRISRLSLLNFI